MYMWDKDPTHYTICPSSAGLSSTLSLSHSLCPVCLYSKIHVASLFLSANPLSPPKKPPSSAVACVSPTSAAHVSWPLLSLRASQGIKAGGYETGVDWVTERSASHWGISSFESPKPVFLSASLQWCIYPSNTFLPRARRQDQLFCRYT